MAETLSAGGERTTNLTADKKALEKFFKRLDDKHDKLASVSSEIRGDIKDIYGKAADDLGITRKVIRHEYKRRRDLAKLQVKEAGFEESEKENLDRIRAALGDLADTPLGRSASGENGNDGDDDESED